MSSSDNSDGIPTSEIEQLMNSMKINSTTNKDFVEGNTQSEIHINTENNNNNDTSSISDQIDQMIGENNNEFNFKMSSKSSSNSYSEDDYHKSNGVTTELNDIVKKNKKHDSDSDSDSDNKNTVKHEVKYVEEDDNEDIDEYETLNTSQKKLARMDMLRKLAELKKKGYMISSDYNINSDYYTMKEEYEYQLTIKEKKS